MDTDAVWSWHAMYWPGRRVVYRHSSGTATYEAEVRVHPPAHRAITSGLEAREDRPMGRDLDDGGASA